jgi:hypothetical protein
VAALGNLGTHQRKSSLTNQHSNQVFKKMMIG